MKSIRIALAITLFLLSASVFATGEQGQTTVNLDGGSISSGYAYGNKTAQVETWNMTELSASMYKDGNYVSGYTVGTAETNVFGKGFVAAGSGVVANLGLGLSSNHLFASGGSDQWAQTTVPHHGKSAVEVSGNTYLFGNIDPVNVNLVSEAYSADHAVGRTNAYGGNNSTIWLNKSVQYPATEHPHH